MPIYKVLMDEARCGAISQAVNGCAAHSSPENLLTCHLIYHKGRGSHSGLVVGEAQGTIIPADTVTITVEGNSLPEGTYRLYFQVQGDPLWHWATFLIG